MRPHWKNYISGWTWAAFYLFAFVGLIWWSPWSGPEPQCANFAGAERDSGYPCFIPHSDGTIEHLYIDHETGEVASSGRLDQTYPERRWTSASAIATYVLGLVALLGLMHDRRQASDQTRRPDS